MKKVSELVANEKVDIYLLISDVQKVPHLMVVRTLL